MLFCNIKDIFDVLCDSQGTPLDGMHASYIPGEPQSSGTCNTSHVHATDAPQHHSHGIELKDIHTTVDKLEASTHALVDGRTMIVCMTPEQKRLLAKFGEITGIDATYKVDMWGLPFFVLVVVNAQGKGYPAAFFWISSETTEAIAEALLHIKHMVPDWKPRVMIMDHSQAEIGAARWVFPGVFILLCDFHIKQAWQRWLSCGEHGVGDQNERRKAYTLLEAIANSTSLKAKNASIGEWEAYLLLRKNDDLTSWWKREYASCTQMWCRADRACIFTRGFNTNNHNEAINKAVKCYLRNRFDFKVASMVRELCEVIVPMYDIKHAESQATECGVTYKNKIDLTLRAFENVHPRNILKLLQSRNREAETIPTRYVAVMQPGKVYQFLATREACSYIASIVDGRCDCLDFKHRRLICKHLFRSLKESGKSVTSLPDHLLKAPHMVFDSGSAASKGYIHHDEHHQPTVNMSDENATNHCDYEHAYASVVHDDTMDECTDASSEPALDVTSLQRQFSKDYKLVSTWFFRNLDAGDATSCQKMASFMQQARVAGQEGHAGDRSEMQSNGFMAKEKYRKTNRPNDVKKGPKDFHNEFDAETQPRRGRPVTKAKSGLKWSSKSLKECNHEGCSTDVEATTRFCTTHATPQRLCRLEGCVKVAGAKTVHCHMHAPRKQCSHEGCSTHAVIRTRFCTIHAILQQKCQHEGCVKVARGSTMHCQQHSTSKQCNHEGCSTHAVARTRFCTTHAISQQKCQHEGCVKVARGNTMHCQPHAPNKHCSHEGCSAHAVGRTQFCTTHAILQEKCQHEGCVKVARANTMHCQPHAASRQCSHEGCSSNVLAKTLF